MADYRDRILLVESDSVDQDFIKKTLEDAGFEVYVSETTRDALGIIRITSPDLVISNILLPDMSGWDFYREVRKDPERLELPFILLGNREEVGERVQAYRLGIEDILYKPLHTEELVEGVNSILKKNIPQEKKTYPPSREEEGIRGRLKDMGLPDILQVLNMSNKTALVYLSHGEQEGKVFLEDGEVVHTECEGLVGEDALYYLLSWADGDFDIEPDVSSPFKTIDSSVENLLLEGMRRIDEEARDGKGGEGNTTLIEKDPESFKVVKHLFELGILEKK